MHFFSSNKKLSRKHLHELVLMCGAVALLMACALFIRIGMPTVVRAWTIYINPFTYTPVIQGGYTTITWYGPNADECIIYGPTFPCYKTRGVFYCDQIVQWGYGSVYTGPINSPTYYSLYCYKASGGWGSSDAYGSSGLWVYPSPPPTPTSIAYFNALPTSVPYNTASTLSWSGIQGNYYYGALIFGGQWGGGVWTNLVGGTANTGAIKSTTQYGLQVYDTHYGWIGPVYTTVTMIPPASCSNGLDPNNYPSCSCPTGQVQTGSSCVIDVCTDVSGIQATLPTGCTGPTPAPSGSCIPAGDNLKGGVCVPPPDRCNNFPGVQSTVPTNCKVNADGVSCSANAGFEVVGSACVPAGVVNQFVATPSRVQKGNQTKLIWSTTNMATCAVVDNNGTSISTALNSSGTAVPITQATTFTLSCTDLGGIAYPQQTITAGVVPITKEQ